MIDSYFENIGKKAKVEHPNPRANFVPFGLRIYRVTPQHNYPILKFRWDKCSCSFAPEVYPCCRQNMHKQGFTIRLFDRIMITYNRRPKGCTAPF